MFSGLPRSENTAWVATSRILVIEPLAESPSVMKSDVSSRLSLSLGARVSQKCTWQSRSLLLLSAVFFARSRACLVTPAIALRSLSLS